MKLIELLNKMANKEKLPNKILIRDIVYYLINDEDENIIYSQRMDKKDWEAFIDHKLNITRCLNEDVLILDTVVEISEEDTIDIDSIKQLGEVSENYAAPIRENRKTINKLIQVLKQHDKEIKELKEK